MDGTADGLGRDWPLLNLRLRVGKIGLRHMREHDLPHLAEMLPADYEHDPGADTFPAHDLAEHRRRLLYQGYWRSVGNWSPTTWCLDFVVEDREEAVGVQSLEASQFLSVRTVDSHSWLTPVARGRGIGVAMRQAVLALAFDQLGALEAVSSARTDNAASLGVSRRLGYVENGIHLNAGTAGLAHLQHMRLSRQVWSASGLASGVQIEGVQACLAWFGLSE